MRAPSRHCNRDNKLKSSSQFSKNRSIVCENILFFVRSGHVGVQIREMNDGGTLNVPGYMNFLYTRGIDATGYVYRFDFETFNIIASQTDKNRFWPLSLRCLTIE